VNLAAKVSQIRPIFDQILILLQKTKDSAVMNGCSHALNGASVVMNRGFVAMNGGSTSRDRGFVAMNGGSTSRDRGFVAMNGGSTSRDRGFVAMNGGSSVMNGAFSSDDSRNYCDEWCLGRMNQGSCSKARVGLDSFKGGGRLIVRITE
jgi:hypothetical protein